MIRAQHTLIAAALASTLIAGLSACGGGSGSGTGTLNMTLVDAPVDEVSQVVVEFTGVEIKAVNGETISITYDQPKTLDLLDLTGGNAELIVDGQVLPAGQVEWIRLMVNEANSYVVNANGQQNLTIPSGAQSGLKLNRPVTIPEDGVAEFIIDFDLRKSVHISNQGYMLRPTLRLIDNHTDGALAGTVDTTTISANCSAGDKAAVYVFAGTNVTPDDINIDGNNIEPVTTAIVDWENSHYTYAVDYIAQGDYTVAFTCDAGLDNPASDETLTFVGTTNITVNAGQTTTQNF